MRGGVGIHTLRFGAMLTDQPLVPQSGDVDAMQAMLQTSSPVRASATIASAPMQYTAPLIGAKQVLGIRGDGTVGPVQVGSSPSIPRSARSVIPMGPPSSDLTSDPAQPSDFFDPGGRRGADVDSQVPLAQQATDAQDGAQYPSYVSMTAADQVSGTPGADDSHPASTTGAHWLGGLVVAGGLLVAVVGGVALFRAVQ